MPHPDVIPTSPGNFPKGSGQELASCVTVEVDRLLERHRLEIHHCLDTWVQSLLEPAEQADLAEGSWAANASQQCAVPGGRPERPLEDPAVPAAAVNQNMVCIAIGVEAQALSAQEPTTKEGDHGAAEPKACSQGGTSAALQNERKSSSNITLPESSQGTSPAASPVSQRTSKSTLFLQPLPHNKSCKKLSGSDIPAGSKKKMTRRPSQMLFSSMRAGLMAPMSTVQRITSSRCYEWFSVLLICSNALFIGVQTQHLAHKVLEEAAAGQPPDEDEPLGFLIMQVIFTCLFMLELAPRWLADGFIGFFRTDDRWWNALDAGVVLLGGLDLLLIATFGNSDILGNLSVLRVSRVVRIVRVVRVIRILKFFRELRLMIFSILRSTKSLLWVVLVLGLTFYIFGIIFTVGTSTALARTSGDTSGLREYFATVDRSFLHLFMAMSGGSDWSRYYTAMEQLPYPYRILFLLYITFSVFAVVNIVTGVFVESAMQSNHDDKVMTAREEMERKKDYLQAMREIFEEMDEDGSGIVSIDQFEEKLADERVIAYFNAMRLNINDARKLFLLIDSDQSKAIDIDEFVEGCYVLQGEARALDMKLMECEVHFLRDRFSMFGKLLQRIDKQVSTLSMPKAV